MDDTEEQAFITVRELMRLEGEQALEAARQRRGRSAGGGPSSASKATSSSSVAGTDPLRLVGIYGVGKRLFAEVRNGSHAWVFLKGHSQPVGQVAGAGDAYRLKDMAGSCVKLERQGVETVLCLPSEGR